MSDIVYERRMDRGSLMSPMWVGETLFVDAYVCRPGIYEYVNQDGTKTRELIRPEMLQESAIGLARLPCTLEHPESDVTVANWSEVAVGDSAEEVIIEDNGYQKVRMAVRRKDAQQDVMSGKRKECSPGYLAKIDRTGGRHPEYGEYDTEQVGRTYNHIAFVQDARGGSRIAARIDSAEPVRWMVDVIRGDAAPNSPPNPGTDMVTPALLNLLALFKVDTRRVDSDDQAVRLLRDEIIRRDTGMDPRMQDEDPKPPEGDSGSMYMDAEGNPLTVDEYVQGLEDENRQLRDMIEHDAEESAMDELEPMAEDEEVEVKKEDSAIDLGRRIASKVLGEELHPDTSPDYIWGVLRARRDSKKADGRGRGRDAWEQARNDSKDPNNQRRREERRDSGRERNPDNVVQLPGLSTIAEKRYDSMFKAAKKGAN